MRYLSIGVLVAIIASTYSCLRNQNDLVGTWYDWDQFNPNGFMDSGLVVQFKEDSTGVMWVHDHFNVSPKFRPDTFAYSQTDDGQLIYQLNDSSTWNPMDNLYDTHYVIDERGLLHWRKHTLKKRI